MYVILKYTVQNNTTNKNKDYVTNVIRIKKRYIPENNKIFRLFAKLILE